VALEETAFAGGFGMQMDLRNEWVKRILAETSSILKAKIQNKIAIF
jgi:hypothetical protein